MKIILTQLKPGDHIWLTPDEKLPVAIQTIEGMRIRRKYMRIIKCYSYTNTYLCKTGILLLDYRNLL